MHRFRMPMMPFRRQLAAYPQLALLGLCIFSLLLVYPAIGRTSSALGLRGTIPRVSNLKAVPDGEWNSHVDATSFRIAMVADLDKKSHIRSHKPLFKSYLRVGELQKSQDGSFSLSWHNEYEMTSQHNEGGRGFELSELLMFNDKLYTFDDRTGLVFEIVNATESGHVAVPRYTLMEGDGNVDKGQKTEWATVKDGKIYAGSFGREFTTNGKISSFNNMWISTIDQGGKVEHVDWTDNYNKLREAAGVPYPGYMVHEAVIWSEARRTWLFFPRRVSSQPYDEVADETRGSNIVIEASEDFSDVRAFRLGIARPLRGFSSAKFIPGTDDKLVLALKSEEVEAEGYQATYATVLDVESRQVVMDDVKVANWKGEGVAFLPPIVVQSADS